MSTKASSAINASANNSPTTNSTMNNTSTTTAATPTVVKIKKELPSDEIKEFAESTMNELLGWYGFDSVDRLDLSAKTSKLLQTAGIISAQQQQQQQQHHQHQQHHHLEKRRSRSSRAASLLHMHQQQQQNEHLRTLNNNHNNSNNNNSNNNNINSSVSSSNNRKTSLSCNNSSGSNINNYRGNDSTTSDHDTRSSRDDDSKSPNSAGKTHSTTTNIIDDKIVDYQNCCWCRRPVAENAPEFLTTSDGPRYCSESCFTQSRRASFKKAKTCDWCKHVRHAVSYVDFQDGASQLQFCSDKCLNQYKMQIFCKETQAHLDMNPHLKEQGLEAASNGANLITPDLWLRNCRSRSASPASTVSLSPGPTVQTNMPGDRGAISPLPRLTLNTGTLPSQPSATSHKPLISVAPVSKLMSKSPSILTNRQSPKHNRKKRPVRACVRDDMSNSRNNEVKTNCSPSLAAVSIKPKPLMPSLNDNNRSGLNQSNTQQTLTQFAASGVQDLHMNVPPLSPMMETQTSQPTTPHSLTPTANRGPTAIPPAFFATTPNNQAPQNAQTMGINAQGFTPRPPFMPNPNNGFLPRFLGNFGGLPPPLPHSAGGGLMPPELTALNTLIGTPPPVTIMVPYPVIIPLPIPIPVPLPVVDFYKAHLTPEERRKYEEEQEMKKEKETKSNETSLSHTEAEEPLDFTKTKDMEQEKSRLKPSNSPETSQEVVDTKEEEDISEESKATTSEDSTCRTKILQCVLSNEEAPQTNTEDNSGSKLKSDFVANNAESNEDSSELQSSSVTTGAGGETNQKLPKLKITRLQTKRTLIQTKESECSRPLRKRKRIIDCDFQKLNSTTVNKDANELNDEELNTTTDNEQNPKGQTNNSNKK